MMIVCFLWFLLIYFQILFKKTTHLQGIYTHFYDTNKSALEVSFTCQVAPFFTKSMTPKHTLSTFSWLQGNLYPGYGLLSITPSDPVKEPTVTACPLPPQILLYVSYIVMLVITLCVVIIIPLFKKKSRRLSSEYIQLPRYQTEEEEPELLSGSRDKVQTMSLVSSVKEFTLVVFYVLVFHGFLLLVL